jgi:hypothetical protein
MVRKALNVHAGPGIVRLNYNNRFANRWGRVIGCVGAKP